MNVHILRIKAAFLCVAFTYKSQICTDKATKNAKIFKTGVMKKHMLSVDNIYSQYCIEIINCRTTNIRNYTTSKEVQVKLRLEIDKAQ